MWQWLIIAASAIGLAVYSFIAALIAAAVAGGDAHLLPEDHWTRRARARFSAIRALFHMFVAAAAIGAGAPHLWPRPRRGIAWAAG